MNSSSGGVSQPIPYQGSKRQLANTILSYFPSDVERLVEPFAGSAAVSLAAAYCGRAKSFWLNDINAPLMRLWQEVVDRPVELALAYGRLWTDQQEREREYYDVVRDTFNKTGRPDCLLYLLARCVKASVRYNPKGEFNQSPDNRRRGARPSTMKKRITWASALLKGRTVVTAFDYRQVLSAVQPHDLVYMDPPYQGVSEGRDPRYVGGVFPSEFVEALAALNTRRCCYIVSYDGASGGKAYGNGLPASLGLVHLEIDAGRSSQATLLGRSDTTVESLYLSPALLRQLQTANVPQPAPRQLQLSLTVV